MDPKVAQATVDTSAAAGQDAGEPLLKVRDLCVHFPLGKHRTLKAVEGVSFDINPGETFASGWRVRFGQDHHGTRHNPP